MLGYDDGEEEGRLLGSEEGSGLGWFDGSVEG